MIAAILALLVSGCSQASGAGTAAVAPLRPDILVVVIDDVADSDIDEVSGKGWLPNIDALAARGVRFHRCYAHAKCAPTRDSLMVSSWLGLDRGDACDVPAPDSIGPDTFTMFRMMGGAGYHTLHVGKYHVGATSIGPWELSPELGSGAGAVRSAVPVGPTCNVAGVDQPRLDDGVYSVFRGDNTIACRDALLQWWAATPSPRFAMVAFGAAHAPFKYPDPSLLPVGYPSCPPLNCTNRKEFEAEIVGVDTALGQMVSAVGSPTYVFFLGDNGTPGIVPGESPAVTVATRSNQDPHRVKLTCWEDGVRVPLIVAGPKVSAGHLSQSMVHVSYLLPTIAIMCGIQPLPTTLASVHGKSFAASLIGLPGLQSPVFVWNPPPSLDRAMIGPRWKLLTRTDGVEELYDLQLDPLETTPLPPTGPDADALRAARDVILAGG